MKIKIHLRDYLVPGGGGGGVLPGKFGWGCAARFPKTLTLFMTKLCNIPYPIYDLTKNSIPYL